MSTTMAGTLSVYFGRGTETVRMALLRIAMIDIPTFQRDRKNDFIQKVAAEPDETAFIFPIVVTFQDHYVCIDGQQRLAAWEANGMEEATVLLIEGIDKAERLADIFLKINRDRKLLNALEKYIGALASKDKGTLGIQRLVEDFDLEVGHAATANGKVPAGAVARIQERGGVDLLQRTLMIREMAWGGLGAREANEGKTLLGLASFLRKYDDKINDDRLVAILRRQHPGFVLSAIERNRGERISYADYLREHYNKGLRGAGKL